MHASRRYQLIEVVVEIEKSMTLRTDTFYNQFIISYKFMARALYVNIQNNHGLKIPKLQGCQQSKHPGLPIHILSLHIVKINMCAPLS